MTFKIEGYRRSYSSSTTRQHKIEQNGMFASKEFSKLREPKWTCSQIRGALDDFVRRDFHIPLDSRSEVAFGKHLTDCRSCSSLIPKVINKIQNPGVPFTTVAPDADEQEKRIRLIIKTLFVK